MKKSKKQKEDRYFLLALLLSILSILCLEVTFFREYRIIMLICFSVFTFLELFVCSIIIKENERKHSYLALVLSSLAVVLFDMLLMTFSNQMISYLEIGKYILIYLCCFGAFIFFYSYCYPKKKLLSKFVFIIILLSNLLLTYFIT